jgi:hypothetical protein
MSRSPASSTALTTSAIVHCHSIAWFREPGAKRSMADAGKLSFGQVPPK